MYDNCFINETYKVSVCKINLFIAYNDGINIKFSSAFCYLIGFVCFV